MGIPNVKVRFTEEGKKRELVSCLLTVLFPALSLSSMSRNLAKLMIFFNEEAVA